MTEWLLDAVGGGFGAEEAGMKGCAGRVYSPRVEARTSSQSEAGDSSRMRMSDTRAISWTCICYDMR